MSPIAKFMSANSADKYRLAIQKSQKVQRLALFVIAVASLGVAWLVGFGLAKGLIFGAMIAFFMQSAFTFLSFWRARPHPKTMMNDMYLAMMVRWGIGMLGFVVAFGWLKLNGLGVVLGFLSMQAFIFVSLHNVRA